MDRQENQDEHAAEERREQKIAVVTDSAADIPYELAERLGIQIVPNTIVIEGQSLLDGKDFERDTFYEQLPKMKNSPTTATASPGAYQQLYESLLEKGFQHILSIHPSGLLSGIINAASTAAQSCSQCVHVIDSGSVSMGLGFQVLAAAEAVITEGAHSSAHSLESVLKLLEELRGRVRVVAMLDTLEYVRRSGRVSWARARLGELLHVKPFIEVRDGQVLSLGEARTHRKGVNRLVELLHAQGPLERLAIVHTNAELEARQVLEDYRQQLQAQQTALALQAEPLFVNITTVIGAHVGPGALGFAAVVK
jgi:DegV family protein with EDD domain